MKVENLTNDKYNKAVNQFVITTANAVYFQSYDTPCAKYANGRVFLNRNYFGENFSGGSKTTNKHLYIWLHDYAHFGYNQCYAKEIRKLIKDNEITLVSEEELEYAS